MGDARGELPDRFELLGLHELMLEPLPLGNIVDEGVEDEAVLGGPRRL
jgi:hypothetical protein